MRSHTLFLVVVLTSCGLGFEAPAVSSPRDTSSLLADETNASATGGVFATFQVNDQQFSSWITNEGGVRQALKLWRGRASGLHPSGPLLCGSEWNGPWSWHLDGAQVAFVELSIELCDGRPSDVEAAGCGYANGQYCPWGAQLISLRDCRKSTLPPPQCPVATRAQD